jgi:hypothetical protein
MTTYAGALSKQCLRCLLVDLGVMLACDGLLVPQSSLLGGGEALGYTQCWQIYNLFNVK